ncbi:hypothetical protein H4582DRAFT_2063553 [Lactarius indigo]|nr:hypothetical protein H4582DRAFT_2063553 [Lactarius indigo]
MEVWCCDICRGADGGWTLGMRGSLMNRREWNLGALDPTESFVQCVGDSTNLKSSDGHPARPQVTILGFEFQAPCTLPDGPRVVLHSAGATYKRHTTPYMVSGYVWQRWPRRRITSTFVTVSPLRGHLIDTPYVNIEREFFLPGVSPPEVYDTLVQVSCYKLLVTGYLNGSLGPNPNLQRDFPLIPWKGEIAVLFIGKRKPYISRAPPQSLVRFAITQYMEVCIAHAEVGSPFPSYIRSIWPGHGVSGRGVSAFASN